MTAAARTLLGLSPTNKRSLNESYAGNAAKRVFCTAPLQEYRIAAHADLRGDMLVELGKVDFFGSEIVDCSGPQVCAAGQS